MENEDARKTPVTCSNWDVLFKPVFMGRRAFSPLPPLLCAHSKRWLVSSNHTSTQHTTAPSWHLGENGGRLYFNAGTHSCTGHTTDTRLYLQGHAVISRVSGGVGWSGWSGWWEGIRVGSPPQTCLLLVGWVDHCLTLFSTLSTLHLPCLPPMMVRLWDSLDEGIEACREWMVIVWYGDSNTRTLVIASLSGVLLPILLCHTPPRLQSLPNPLSAYYGCRPLWPLRASIWLSHLNWSPGTDQLALGLISSQLISRW